MPNVPLKNRTNFGKNVSTIVAIIGVIVLLLIFFDNRKPQGHLSSSFLNEQKIAFVSTQHQTQKNNSSDFLIEAEQWYAWSNQSESILQNNNHGILLPSLSQGKYLLVVSVLGDANKNHFIKISSDLSSPHFITDDQSSLINLWEKVSPRKNGLITQQIPWHQLASQRSELQQISFQIPVKKRAINKRRFFLPKLSQKKTNFQQIAIQASLLHSKNNLNIWLDQSLSANSRYEKLASQLAQHFESHVSNWSRIHLSKYAPKPIHFVITPYLKNLGNKKSPVKMCVTVPQSLDEKEVLQKNADTIFIHADLDHLLCSEISNGTAKEKSGNKELATLLAHEFFHLCSLNAMPHHPNQQEIHEWIFEGWAHAAEKACTGSDFNFASRVNEFRLHPEHSPLWVKSSASLGRYRDLGIRGASASFFSFLSKKYPEITWEQRLSSGLTPTGIESLHQQSFSELFRHWTCFEAEKNWRDNQQPVCNNSNKLVTHLPGDQTQFPLQGSTSRTILINCDSSLQKSFVGQRIKIHATQKSPLQLTLLKIE